MLVVGWVRRYEVWKVKYILKFNIVCIQTRSWNSWKSQSHFGPVAQILISQPHSCENVLSAHPHNNSTYERGWQPGTMFWCHESLPLALSCSYACARVNISTYPRLNKTYWGMCNSHIHGPPIPLLMWEPWCSGQGRWWSQNLDPSAQAWGSILLISEEIQPLKWRGHTLSFLLLIIWNVLQDVLKVRTKIDLSRTLLSSLSAMVSISKIREIWKRELPKTVIHPWMFLLKVFCMKAAEKFLRSTVIIICLYGRVVSKEQQYWATYKHLLFVC